MKKKNLATILFAVGLNLGYSQFSNTTNPFTNGNVGIGGQNTSTTTKLFLNSDANWSLISTLNTYNNFSGGFRLLNSGGGAYDAPSLELRNNQNQQIFYTGGAQGIGVNKVKIPGIYNFETTCIGQFGNGASGVEFINHVGTDNSYGVRLMANSDEFSGLQIKTANPAASYGQLNFVRNFALGTDGRVFIGSSSIPAGNHKLSVDGNINLTSGDKKLNVSGVYNFEATNIGQYGNGAGGVEFINHAGTDNSYGVRLMANSDEFSGLQIKTANPAASYGQLNYTKKMSIGLDGKVSIGNVTTPGNYLLYVEKGILTEEVKVALKSSTAWADYVFNKNYKLRSLKEVEEFIQENKHLPNVPSAEELMNDGGVNVSSMMSKQMEKIEELTLYIIEQNKKLEKLQAQVNKLQNN